MKTYIAYFDKTGDDGVTMDSSDHFVLMSLYMPARNEALPTSHLRVQWFNNIVYNEFASCQ